MISIKTISEFHELVNLPKPRHPLFSVINVATVTQSNNNKPENMALDFFSIAVKRMSNVKIKYGQQPFDFNEGILSFMSPNQVFSVVIDNEEEEVQRSGWVINIHPDFIWNTSLAKTINNYDFWDYSLNEGLFLSAKEEEIINNIILTIEQECDTSIDKFSKPIIISHIESLLNYADRFYHRQFITREKANHQILSRLEKLLNHSFTNEYLATKGLPTVEYISESLQLSPNYLRGLLKVLTGLNTQQHIHEKLIEKAKEKLSTTDLSVSEIAYELGFEHPQSFSILFKKKTKSTPSEFRQSFS